MNVPRKKRKEYYPFYIDYDSNRTPPGHFEIVRVYFKPRKTVGMNEKKKKKNDKVCKFFMQGIPFSKKCSSFHAVLHRNEIEHNRGHEPRNACYLADRTWNRKEFKYSQIQHSIQSRYSVYRNPGNRFHD